MNIGLNKEEHPELFEVAEAEFQEWAGMWVNITCKCLKGCPDNKDAFMAGFETAVALLRDAIVDEVHAHVLRVSDPEDGHRQ